MKMELLAQKAIDRINRELKYLNLFYKDDEFAKHWLDVLFGKVSMAAELGLISHQDWEDYFDKIYALSKGEA